MKEKIGAAILVILALAIPSTAFLQACGADQRQTTLKVATSGVDVAEATLHAYDVRHQVELAKKAPDQASARVAVDAWKATRNKIDLEINAAYKALLAAALVNDDPSLTGALAAAKVVTDELRALKVVP